MIVILYKGSSEEFLTGSMDFTGHKKNKRPRKMGKIRVGCSSLPSEYKCPLSCGYTCPNPDTLQMILEAAMRSGGEKHGTYHANATLEEALSVQQRQAWPSSISALNTELEENDPN